MGYTSRRGRRPSEFASKSSHSHVVQDPLVQAFLTKCNLPKPAGEVRLAEHRCIPFTPVKDNPIRYVIAIDGGYSEVAVRKEFPSATLCFLQFGALIFSIADLDGLGDQPFIDPDDMAKLKRIQRLKLILPIRNVSLQSEGSLTKSIRRSIYDFFRQNMDDGGLIDTLRWFLFQEYANPQPTWGLASCPLCAARDIPIHRENLSREHTCQCSACGGELFLTDVFRLHEVIDDELGAGEIVGYMTTTIEQFILAHLIRLLLKTKPVLLRQILFVKDGPLAFFGQTANMHQPMRTLVAFLFQRHDLHLAGLEKSGPFVEHADEIRDLLDPGSVLLLDDPYIYRYVLPAKGEAKHPYGSSTYYSQKLIFKTPGSQVYIVSLPTAAAVPRPTEGDIRNLQSILTNVEKLRCDMYDNALVPVALVNKLVSLANHPSSRILQKFAKDSLGK